MSRTRLVILGAGGRDFHDFNRLYRDDPAVEVVAFTATQIPGIAGRRYPPELAGPLYPAGIPIVGEAELEALCRRDAVDRVVFAYSDVPHTHVMHLASRALAAGASFELPGTAATQVVAGVPVIAVSAVRTGCGKSQTARYLSRLLRDAGRRVAVIRHPMPYGDLSRQAVQRFATRADLGAAACTIEEREEYEPHLAAGNVVFAGVDYARVVERAQAEADLILWDGGNNDFPFVRPDLHIVLVDALRPGDAASHHPGEAVLRMADVIVIAKCDAASAQAVAQVTAAARAVNPRAAIMRAMSPVSLDDAEAVRGRRVLVVEDGPTLTHGGMPWGAGHVAALAAGGTLVDPRPYAVAGIREAFVQYPHIGPVLPALGYSPEQVAALRQSVRATPAEVVVAATPIDLAALLDLDRPVVRARYEFAEAETPGLAGIVADFLGRLER
jgi:predicted GTPase